MSDLHQEESNSSNGRLISIGVLLFVVLSALISWHYWGDLKGQNESTSTTLRNLGILFGGPIAILLATWRSIVAHRQAISSQLQANVAYQSLQNDRYQRAAEMLGNSTPSVRMGGIYSLVDLAETNPRDYGVLVTKLLCAFVREPMNSQISLTGVDPEETQDGVQSESDAIPELRKDVQTAISLIGRKSYHDRVAVFYTESYQDDWIEGSPLYDLHGADLCGGELLGVKLAFANLKNAQLVWTNLDLADLSDALIDDANLSHASLHGANLSGVLLENSDLSCSKLVNANLSGARLLGANLTDADLRTANLKDTNLYHANLFKAKLDNTNIDEAQIGEANLRVQRLPPSEEIEGRDDHDV